MICEIKVDGKPHRFHISFVSNVSRYGTPESDKLDIELTDISEDPTDIYNGKRIDHYKWKEAIRDNKVIIIN